MRTELRHYNKPRLIHFGSVRNLTGGSATVGRDGAVTSSRNSPGGG
ncbi:hypothetical protein [uncultured Erythrobacter sp.]|nr:hypothetical protein [uncultured Erythrobacter sp.]